MKLFRQLTVNHISFKPAPFKREIYLQGFLLNNEQILSLGEPPYDDVSILDDEKKLKRASSNTGKGRLDLLMRYSEGYYGIAELKKGNLDDQSLNQLIEYLDPTNLEALEHEIPDDDQPLGWVGVLVGTGIDTKLADRIENGLAHGKIPIAAIILERFQHGLDAFVVSTSHFNPSKKIKDYTKYAFKGQTYGKGRLVLAVIQDYIENNPEVNFSSLKKAFPDSLQSPSKGSNRMGVFQKHEYAENINSSYGYKRYYSEQSELRQLADNNLIAVCSQWGIGNIGRFIKRAYELGYIIEEIK